MVPPLDFGLARNEQTLLLFKQSGSVAGSKPSGDYPRGFASGLDDGRYGAWRSMIGNSLIDSVEWNVALVIDPFDSNHWLYGTGATIYGGHDLLEVNTVPILNVFRNCAYAHNS